MIYSSHENRQFKKNILNLNFISNSPYPLLWGVTYKMYHILREVDAPSDFYYAESNIPILYTAQCHLGIFIFAQKTPRAVKFGESKFPV